MSAAFNLDDIQCEYLGQSTEHGKSRYRFIFTQEFDYATPNPEDREDCQRTAQLVARKALYQGVKDIASAIEYIAWDGNRIRQFHGDKPDSNLTKIESLCKDMLEIIPNLKNEGASF